MKIKICGITTIEDALFCVENGADALGFIFYRKSKRFIEPEAAAQIISRIPPFISSVGVFVDEERSTILNIHNTCHLNVLQFHGDETPEYVQSFATQKVIKAIRVKDANSIKSIKDFKVSAFLLDSYVKGVQGGTGVTFNWALVEEAKQYGKIILSGGLNPGNIKEAILKVKPYAVDASSSLETAPGIKNRELVKQFIEEARKAGG
ncbi:MAG: phosphoribosylanthranilate isomerase [Candidatus Schekmanbacteria bacterium]|nr:phosphoribosylanthranilate isomerase [Candidatus Schekmanbacteria bacterium]